MANSQPSRHPLHAMPEATRRVFEQLNRTLVEKSREAGVLQHNLAQGLSNEEAVRRLLRAFLPARYGVAKGKVVNRAGDLSRQCDVIVYDALNCPRLFVDEDGNQIIPAEGVFEVVEIKARLSAGKLRDAFEELNSVYEVAGARRTVRSRNDFVDHRPPALSVLAFRAPKLETVLRAYDDLSRRFAVDHSTSTYSSRSPGHRDMTDRTFLIDHVWVLNAGCVYSMLTNDLMIGRYGIFTLGMFLTGMVDTYAEYALGEVLMTGYLNYLMIEDRPVGERISEWNAPSGGEYAKSSE